MHSFPAFVDDACWQGEVAASTIFPIYWDTVRETGSGSSSSFAWGLAFACLHDLVGFLLQNERCTRTGDLPVCGNA